MAGRRRNRGGGLRQGAELAFRKAFGGDGVHAVETGAGVFPGDYGDEFDQLAFGELLAQGVVEFVGNVSGNVGECGGEAKDRFLLFVEMSAGFELGQIM